MTWQSGRQYHQFKRRNQGIRDEKDSHKSIMKSSVNLTLIITFLVFSSSISLQVNPDYQGFQILHDGIYQRIVLPEYPCLGMEGEPELPHMPG